MKNALCIVAAVLLAATVVEAKVGGGEVRFSVNGASAVVFDHESHVIKAGVKCTECHYRVFNTKEARKAVTMANMQKGWSCGACHDGKKAFDVKMNCSKCHK
jgi:c(7)-type cytochrome triheme protein